MKFVIIFLFYFLIHGISCSIDLSLVPGSSGSAVVHVCVLKVFNLDLFTKSKDEEFLRRIAYAETRDGQDPNTYFDPNNDGGIWQLSSEKYEQTKTSSAQSVLLDGIYEKLGIYWANTTWSDLRKPLYSALAARLYLEVIGVSLPLSIDLAGQANFWVTYYTNSTGTEDDFEMAVTYLKQHEGCEVSALDLIFLLDTSGSVSANNFELMKDLTHDMVNQFDVAPDAVRVAVFSFSDVMRYHFHLNTYSTKSEVLSAISNIAYSGGSTLTDIALHSLIEIGFVSSHGVRPVSQVVPRVAVVITDGMSTDPQRTVTAAHDVHEAGIITFAIGISGANIAELNIIASKPSYKYVSFIASFDATLISNLQVHLSQLTCDASPTLSPNDTLTDTIGANNTKFFNYPVFNETGITLKFNSSGNCSLYGSSLIQLPSEALNDLAILRSGYHEGHVNYDRLTDKFYLTVSCVEESNIILEIEYEKYTEQTVVPVTVSVDPSTMSVFYLSQVSTTCHSNGNPSPSVAWYGPDGSIVKTGGDVSVVETIMNSTNVSSELIILSVAEGGIYTCIGSNNLSNGSIHSDSAIFNVTVKNRITNLIGYAIDSTAIYLTWSLMPGAVMEYFIVKCEELETGRKWRFLTVESNITIVSLKPDHLYTCEFPIKDDPNAPIEASINIHTNKTEMAKPGCVSGLSGQVINGTTVLLTWGPPPSTSTSSSNNDMIGYEITYTGYEMTISHTSRTRYTRSQGDDSGYTQYGPYTQFVYPMDDEMETTISSLTKGLAYEIKVRGLNEAGFGEFNSIITFTPPPLSPPSTTTTPAVAQVPGVPVLLTGDFVGNDSVVLAWNPPRNHGDDIIDYQIRYSGQNLQHTGKYDGPYVVTIESSYYMQTTISNLLPNYNYQFKIWARNGVGFSEDSIILVLMPPSPSVEPIIEAVEKDSSTCCGGGGIGGWTPTSVVLLLMLILLIIVLLAVAVYCYLRYRKNKKQKQNDKMELTPLNNSRRSSSPTFVINNAAETILGAYLDTRQKSQEEEELDIPSNISQQLTRSAANKLQQATKMIGEVDSTPLITNSPSSDTLLNQSTTGNIDNAAGIEDVALRNKPRGLSKTRNLPQTSKYLSSNPPKYKKLQQDRAEQYQEDEVDVEDQFNGEKLPAASGGDRIEEEKSALISGNDDDDEPYSKRNQRKQFKNKLKKSPAVKSNSGEKSLPSAIQI